MTIAVDAPNLYREFETARKYWGQAHTLAALVARRAAGDAYFGNAEVTNPENYYGTHTLHTKARLTSGRMNPRLTTKKRDVSERVQSLEDFARKWIEDTQFVFEFERAVDDMCNGGAVGLVRQATRKGYEQFDDPPNTPIAQRIPINLWGCDPVATIYEGARYAYHVCIEIHADLIAMAEYAPQEWDIEAIRRMKSENLSSLRALPGLQNAVDRKEVSYVVMWVPGYKLPDTDKAWEGVDEDTKAKCHGTIFKFALCGSQGIVASIMGREDAQMIAPPRPYFGPRQGPYVYEGFLDVSNQVRKSSPLIANMGQIEQLNAQERANDLIETRSKTVFAYDGMNPDDAATLESAKHADAVRLAGLDNARSTTIDFPGITADKRARALELAARVRRNLGMPDTALGEASGAATLGENQIADEHLNQVTEYMDRRARRWAAQVILRACWFSENDATTVTQHDGSIMLGGNKRADYEQGIDRARRVGMVGEGEAQEMLADLPDGEEDAVSFDDLQIQVERVKQDETSLARFQSATEFVTVVAPMVPLFAQLGAEGFQKFMDRAADEYGVSELSGLFSMEAAQEMPVPGQEEEPRTAPAPEPPQPAQRSMPAAKPAQGNKPEKMAFKMRSKSA